MILLKNAEVYSPEPLGINDLLVAGKEVVAIANVIDLNNFPDIQIIDCTGLRMIPGLIDAHVHIAGGRSSKMKAKQKRSQNEYR